MWPYGHSGGGGGDVPTPAQRMKPKMQNNTSIFLNAWILKIYYLEVFKLFHLAISWGGGGGGKLSYLEGKLPLGPPP